MLSQIIFITSLFLSIGIFCYSIYKQIYINFKITRPLKINNWKKRFIILLKIAIGQYKIFRFPFAGVLHAITFWGFIIILFGTLEMIIDGITGNIKSLSFIGKPYQVIMMLIDIFAYLIFISIILFLGRRIFNIVQRFKSPEIKKKSKIDALISLLLILILMITLIIINLHEVSSEKTNYLILSKVIHNLTGITFSHNIAKGCWWLHIELIFLFANILPYSKHFHIFTSLPKVFLSRLEPLSYISNMKSITAQIESFNNNSEVNSEINERFGIKDVEDVTWLSYLDSISCTECGRCVSVCPQNLTGKLLSPRKIMMDLRKRMKEKGYKYFKNNDYNDNKSYLYDYITEEEIWACNLCNACAGECPINIYHPQIIIDLRRFLVLEEGKAKGGLQNIFANIENNGAPWQYSPEDRLNWAKEDNIEIPVMKDEVAKGHYPEYLYWVGCAGAYDFRYKKVAKKFAQILNKAGIDYAVLGTEETCTGDPAKRAGNEFVFQMQAFKNIEIFKRYNIKKIITTCPHCYNILKNEYPSFGYQFETIHYTTILNKLLDENKLKPLPINNISVTYHDPCYLGRGNNIYEEPRTIIKKLGYKIIEIKQSKSFSTCCGAGGAQFFKESEKGTQEVYEYRTSQLLQSNTKTIITSCPFCINMLNDGLKKLNKDTEVKIYDITELINTE
ncbi:MAG: heterodisulfide reductase-related iron-sulfur binding cluster [Bacteroidales bacterium]|nr:heterodisulfide reductase-related iron-sulfur binding cluster [Bacteroidales bacterium]